MVRILEIFDFDWTLFRSPFPPVDHRGDGWWDDPKSLEPPHVPLRPGREFWIEEIVRELRAACRRKGSLTAVITARRAQTSPRIERLFEQRNLKPDIAICRSANFRKDKDSVHFKRKAVYDELKGRTSIRKIILWEDTQDQIDGIRDLANRKGLDFEGNLVTEIENT
jgi:hypothetical protein